MEAQSMIYHKGVCRQKAGYFQTYDNPPYSSSWLKVQNIELRCNVDSLLSDLNRMTELQAGCLRAHRPFWTFRQATPFGRADIRRNQMTIELEFGAEGIETSPSADIEVITDLLNAPKSFVGFRIMVVRFLNMPSRWTTADKDCIKLAVKDILEPYLGAAVDYEGNGKDDRRMIFHPWSNVGSQSHTLEPVWFMNRNHGQGRVMTVDEEEEDRLLEMRFE